MVNQLRHLGIVALFSGFTWIVTSACSSTNSATGPAGPGPNGASLCEATCPKTCGQDSDCNVGSGELCCDYGSTYGKACTSSASCPRFCNGDSQCNTTNGEACCAVSAGSTQKVCAASTSCVQSCTNDTQCQTGNGIDSGFVQPTTTQCLTALESPICVPSTEWRASCKTSTDCNTGTGQICCTTLSLTSRPGVIAAGAGLCMDVPDATFGTCPVACGSDSDCAGKTQGGICCQGACATTCASTCKSDSDCSATSSNRICCGTAAISSPFWGGVAVQ